MTIGERIEERRKALGIPSQSELARMADMRQSTLNGLIRKPYRWSPYLTALARALETTVEYLVGEVDHPEESATDIATGSTVAERLREAMEEAGVDQSALGNAIGVTQGTISLILLGKTRHSKHLPTIATFLGVSYEWLVGRSDAKHGEASESAPVSADERALLEGLRSLGKADRASLHTVVDGFVTARRRVSEPSSELPSEAALTAMFQAQLQAFARLQGDDLARALAKRLPRALARLQDVTMYEATEPLDEELEGGEPPATDHHEPRQAQRK